MAGAEAASALAWAGAARRSGGRLSGPGRVLLRQLRSKGMTAQIGEIRFEESGIVLRYQDRLDVYLDREDDFAYRLRYLAAVLEKLEENETGTIRWDAEGSARFIPG